MEEESLQDIEDRIHFLIYESFFFTKEEFKKNDKIRSIFMHGEIRYYKKCDKCGKRYFKRDESECPHFE